MNGDGRRVSPTPRRGPAGGPAGSRPEGAAGVRPRTRATGRTDHCAVLAARFAALFCEVEAGRRPRRHLAPVMAPLLYARVVDSWIRGGEPGVVIRVGGGAVTPHVYEAVAVVRRGERIGAIAIRLVHRRSGWRVEDLARPEDGPLPPSPYPILDEEDDRLDSATFDAA